jgi:hypothetical protein
MNSDLPEAHVGTVVRSAIEHELHVDSVQFPSGSCLDIGTQEDMRRAIHLAGTGDVRAAL